MATHGRLPLPTTFLSPVLFLSHHTRSSLRHGGATEHRKVYLCVIAENAFVYWYCWL